ncbi:hypothetical protein [Streptomyces sp. GbtcB6]|uniref:hypothetical protein n=1 Tax=Streptomyces sp. GbtcB6 TaxID=2824751 RepID=UPI0027E55694|nr:hypothetical protein [Streptomyces sp. GbtcB6]
MSRRPRLFVRTLTGAAIALLVGGCGGSGGSSAGDDSAAAGTGKVSSASASPSVSARTDRPHVTLPSDVTDEYSGWRTGDAAKDAVLADVAARIDSTNDAILRGDTSAPGLYFYYRDKALSGAVAWIQAYLDADLSFTGTTRYYAPKVTLASGKTTATVLYCSDESKGFNKNRKTGKVDRTPSDQSPYVLYDTRVEKNDSGVWQTTALTSHRGDKACVG